jgi:nitrogen fixation protein NifU and related proteins
VRLEQIYQEVILDHYKHPHHRGLREPFGAESYQVNPTCGDEVRLRVALSDDGERIADVSYDGQGCSISQASTSMMSAAVKGKSRAEVERITRAFKEMMSIHESRIGGDVADGGADGSDGSDEPPVDLGDLEALRGVVKFPVRIKCATLAWNTLQNVFADSDQPATSDN